MLVIIKLIKYFFSTLYWSLQSKERISKMQLNKFKNIFEYARENSQFYREIYTRAGVLDLDIKSWDDIEKVPIVSKDDMRQYELSNIITTENINTCNIHSTSGSSGTPFRIAYSKYEDYTGHVRLLFLLLKNGYSPFKRLLLITKNKPNEKTDIEKDINLITRMRRFLGLFNSEVISIYETADKIISKIEEYKPYLLWTTPSSAYIIAKTLKKQNKKLNVPLLLLISENLPDEHAQLCKEFLCINYIDHYGCMEAPTMGYSKNNSMTKEIFSSFVFLEVLNKRKVDNYEVGDLILTNLLFKNMPFIRYNIGDFIEILQDDTFLNKRIGRIYGRINDIIKIENEEIFHMKLSQIYRGYIKLEQYKLVLDRKRLELHVKVSDKYNEEEVLKETEQMWYNTYPNINISVISKEDFEIDKKTGKFKVIEIKNNEE